MIREAVENKKTVKPGLKKCTNMKGNRRIIFPGGRRAKEEVVMDVRLGMWMKVVDKYYKEASKDSIQKSDSQTN